LDYARGQSPRTIAKALNAQGIAGPRGGKWSASLLLGSASREIGILRNRLYVGERVWNRQQFIKDPTTGRRVARPNPRDAGVTSSVPDLRIIDAATWQATQQRLAAGREAILGLRSSEGVSDATMGARLAGARRPVWALSGLVRCGLCQGPMGVVANEGRLGCSNHKERGTCTNKRAVLRGPLLQRVLAGLRQRLLAPELVEEFVRSYVAGVNAGNRERSKDSGRFAQDLVKVRRQIRNMLDLMKEGHGSGSMVSELRTLEHREAELVAKIAQAEMPEMIPVLHPNLPQLYRRKVEALEVALGNPATASLAIEALRSLIDAIVVMPGEKRGEVSITLRGDLAAFMHKDDVAQTETAALPRESGCFVEVVGSLVAGTRSHLYRTTFRTG
jgi:site-specific DNA recombinase